MGTTAASRGRPWRLAGLAAGAVLVAGPFVPIGPAGAAGTPTVTGTPPVTASPTTPVLTCRMPLGSPLPTATATAAPPAMAAPAPAPAAAQPQPAQAQPAQARPGQDRLAQAQPAQARPARPRPERDRPARPPRTQPEPMAAPTGTTSPGDTTPPTAPGNLTATLPAPTTAALTWSAASDDTGVTAYQVWGGVYSEAPGWATICATTQITTVAGTVHAIDLPVVPPTNPKVTLVRYTLFVKAVDAAGNVSAPSDPARITVRPAPRS